MARTDFTTSSAFNAQAARMVPRSRRLTPNSGVLVINEFGYRTEAAPGQLATWVRAAPMFSTSRYVDFAFGGRSTGNYAGYFLADQQIVQLAPMAGQAARGVYSGVTAMYAPPEFNRFTQYYELRL
jgi:porin